jgi:glycosyltransferase involved in cell wall biosynthesis
MRFSVITATYNCQQTLQGVFDTLDRQTHRDFEHIVVDGASSDGTLEMIKQRAMLGLCRYVSEPDDGIYDALNKGIAMARGDVVGFLHADDQWPASNVLDALENAFLYHRADVVWGDLIYVSQAEPQRVIRRWSSSPLSSLQLQLGWMPPHPACFMRLSVYKSKGCFDSGYRIAGDYEHLLRVLTDTTLVKAYLPKVLVHMRMGGVSNRSLSHLWQKSSEDFRAIRTHHLAGVLTLLFKNIRKVTQFL